MTKLSRAIRRWWYGIREPYLTPEKMLRIWGEGTPVGLIHLIHDRHTSLCALNATGHRGPCTCVVPHDAKDKTP